MLRLPASLSGRRSGEIPWGISHLTRRDRRSGSDRYKDRGRLFISGAHRPRLFSEHGKFAVVKLRSDELVGRLVKGSNPGNTVKYYHFYEGVLPMKAVESHRVLSSTK